MTPRLPLFSALAFALLASLATPTSAQMASLGSDNGQKPVEILADNGIEWHREQQRYLARGNASATQGETSVHGDVLIAYYRSQPGGGTEIFRYEVQGRARIVNPTQTAVGDKAVYDIDTGVLVMTGKSLKITTPTDTITARDSLEYWEKKRIAVARGDAVAVSAERRMTGDVLTAHFVEGRSAPPPQRTAARGQQTRARPQPAPTPAASGSTGQRMQRIEGFGSVHVSTPTDIVRADRGVYNADTSIAMMSGDVRITRGQNQLNGDFAEVNLNTGISRLLTRADSGDKRVRGLFVPQNAQAGQQQPQTGQPQPGQPAPRREQR